MKAMAKSAPKPTTKATLLLTNSPNQACAPHVTKPNSASEAISFMSPTYTQPATEERRAMNPATYNPVLDDAGRPVFNVKIDGFAASHFKLIADVTTGAMLSTDPIDAADVLRFTAEEASEQLAQLWYLGLSPIGFAQLEDLKARFEVYAAELLDVMMDAGIRDEVWLGVACDAFLIGGLAAFDRLLASPAPGRA